MSWKSTVILVRSCLYSLLVTSPVASQVPDDDVTEIEQEDVPTYAVEIIIFRQLSHDASYPEDFSPLSPPQAELPIGDTDFWTDKTDENDHSQAADVATHETAPEGEELEPATLSFELIPEELLKLMDKFDRLETLDRYQPLLHVGWIQAGHDNETALPFEIAAVAEDASLLTGDITLLRTRFLHLKVDLRLEHGGAPDFRMHEDRRIRRLGKLYSFDHPAYGMIAVVDRFEPEDQPPLEPELPASVR